jgi:uncharacterized protein (TIGR02246 family)
MKNKIHLASTIALAMLASPGLEKTAADFIVAFNQKDAAAIAGLFAEQGEITDIEAQEVTTGREEIKAHYAEIFADKDSAAIALEVDSVRLVGPGLAIEDGTVHSTFPGDHFPARSMTYTAVLRKNEGGAWQIASTRNLRDVTSAAGHLAGLANQVKGDWTCQKEDTRFDIAFGWDDSGQFVTGELLVTKAAAKPLSSKLRFGWDDVHKTISCWTFDDAGGFAKADWTPVDGIWQVRTEGTTAEGESMSANQSLAFEGKDAFVWSGKDRLIDGESQPEAKLRFVRQSPEPQAGADAE